MSALLYTCTAFLGAHIKLLMMIDKVEVEIIDIEYGTLPPPLLCLFVTITALPRIDMILVCSELLIDTKGSESVESVSVDIF